MSRARLIRLYSLSRTIKLNEIRREAARLAEEIARIDQRLEQVVQLQTGYREHLRLPVLSMIEVRGVNDIVGRLNERRQVDSARRDVLETERVRIAAMLAERKRQIEKLEEEERQARRLERAEREAIREALMPSPRRGPA